MKICLTGKMKMNRQEETSRFSHYGIQVMKKVTGTTDYLVTGDRPGQSKITDADTHGTLVMTEDEFFSYLIEKYPEYLL